MNEPITSSLDDRMARTAFVLKHTSFEGKVTWLDGDPTPHWRDDLVPSCMVWERDILVTTILGPEVQSPPGWTKIVEFQIVLLS